ncbi:MAG: FMN-binding protein [bacterium]|nr:FMN-binding protein [bacterium]
MNRSSLLAICAIAVVFASTCVLCADGKPTRTREEVVALIEAAGTTRPQWWDSVPLEYPETLDLSFAQPPQGEPWDSRRNVGQYMWSIINENAGRFEQGTKFMHYVMKLNEDDPWVVRRCMEQLAHCYHDLLQDWARAAYWRRKLGVRDVTLANCYWQLGNKEMAVEIMAGIGYDPSRYGGAIKQWADMGELEQARKLAVVSMGSRDWGAAQRALADAYRKFGRYEEAIDYYEQVLAVVSQSEDNLILKHNQDHARLALENIRLYETFDLGKVQDGSFAASVPAYNGDLALRVTVGAHAILAVEITEHHEKQFYSSLTDMPERILAAQDFRGIDATTGATVTAEAIKSAVARALSQGTKTQ